MTTPMHVYRPTPRHRKWWIAFKDHRGFWRKAPGDRAKTTALRHGERITLLVRARLNGDPPPLELSDWLTRMPPALAKKLIAFDLIDQRRMEEDRPIYLAHEEGHAAVPTGRDEAGRWTTLLSEWRQALVDANNTPKHADAQVGYVCRLLSSLSIVRAGEITRYNFPAEVTTALAQRRRAGIGETASNHYLQAMKQFCGWLARAKKIIAANPLVEVKPVKTQETPPHQRRPLSVEEFQRLLAHLTTVGRYKRQRAAWTGRDRLLLYWTAVSTAFRAGALRGLRTGDFHLEDDDDAWVSLPAHLAKSRNDHQVRLPADLVGQLRPYLQMKVPAQRAFVMPGPQSVVNTLRKDLAGAGVEASNEQGIIDFHSFRHTAITWFLDVYELNPRRVMEIAQLSSLELVMRYSRRFRLTDFSYVDQAPRFDLGGAEKPAVSRA